MVNARRRRALGSVLWLAALAAFPPTGGALEPEPPCGATLALGAAEVVAGEQVVQRVRVWRGADVVEAEWVPPGREPDLRVEPLPGRVDPGLEVVAGQALRVHEERRALFPERPGRLLVAGGSLLCRVRTGDAEHVVEVAVAPASLLVTPPPESGRPPGWAGLVGPVSIQTTVVPAAISLGESVRVAIMVRGGNAWQVPDPLPSLPDTDVFPHRPETTFEQGPRLTAVRHFAYDVVPLTQGDLVLPELRVAYFDPNLGRFEHAVGDSVSVPVGPRPPPPRPAAAEASPAATADGAPPGPPPRADAIWWALAAAAVLCGGALRRRRTRARRASTALPAVDAEADAGGVYARALRAGLRRSVPDADALEPEAIAVLPNLPEPAARACELLLAVERARFDPAATLPSREEVERALAAL